MGSTEKFCLKWNDFYMNLGSALQEIRCEREFFDVTLASEDEQIQAHKVILSACSPFFRAVLKKNKHDHPLVYLKGVKFSELLSILNFMYNGEVNIAQNDLSSFLAVAEDLKVKGLSQTAETTAPPREDKAGEEADTSPNTGSSNQRTSPRPPHKQNTFSSQRSGFSPSPAKRARPNHSKPSGNPAAALSMPKHSLKEDGLVPVKCEPGLQPSQDLELSEELSQDVPKLDTSNRALTADTSLQDSSGYLDDFPVEEYEGMEEGDFQTGEGQDGQHLSNAEILKESREEFFRLVDPFMESTMGEAGKIWLCKACGHNSRTKQHIMNHVEMKHSQGPGYSCPLCSVRVPSYQALHKHFSRNHNAKKKDLLGFSGLPLEFVNYAL